MKELSFDDKRRVIIPGDAEKSLEFAIDDWIATAKEAIREKGRFTVALSGGSTPKAIYEGLLKRKDALDWSKMLLFWSDERACAKDDPESNYRMAMEAAFSKLPVLKEHIFPMNGLGNLEANAKEYEDIIIRHVPSASFDLMMLGMGDDGHTASLFPHTEGLHAKNKLATANFIPSKGVWRLSLTFDCINQSHKTAIYVFGKNKADRIKAIFFGPYEPDLLPIQRVHPALYILDEEAASTC